MTGRCSRCKEMCEANIVDIYRYSPLNHYEFVETGLESNCCSAPLIEDGESSHEE